jgi:hypothetical protein
MLAFARMTQLVRHSGERQNPASGNPAGVLQSRDWRIMPAG